MKIDQFAIAVLVFSAVIVAGLLIVDDVNVNFANMGDESEQLYNYSAKVYENIADSETDAGALLTAAYEGLRLSVIPFKIAGGYIEAVALELPIPPQLVMFLIGAISILFAFAILYLIFRFIPFG